MNSLRGSFKTRTGLMVSRKCLETAYYSLEAIRHVRLSWLRKS